MKILIVSDTHGNLTGFREVLKWEKAVDLLIHCGDIEGQEREIENEAGCPVLMVRGNNDYYTKEPDERQVFIGTVPTFISHGHRYGVSFGYERFRGEAKKRGCALAICGHTHRPVTDESDPDCTVLNPGSLTYPRQANRLPSYIVMNIDRDGRPSYRIKYLRPKQKNRG